MAVFMCAPILMGLLPILFFRLFLALDRKLDFNTSATTPLLIAVQR